MDGGTALNVASLVCELPGLIHVGVSISLYDPAARLDVVPIGLIFSRQILENIQKYRDAETKVARFERLINIHLSEIDADFHFLEGNAHRFTLEIRHNLEHAVRELLRTFRDVCETFSLAKGPDLRIRKGRWALKVHDCLEALVLDMERWQRRFVDYIQILHLSGYGFQDGGSGPRAALVSLCTPTATRIINSTINRTDSINDEPSQLASLPVQDHELESMAGSHLQKPRATVSRTDFLVECRHVNRNENADHVEAVLQNTVGILASANPHLMHVLRCEGYVTRPLHRLHQLVLSFPPGMDTPRTLRDLLLDDTIPRPSIGARVQLGRDIATAVLHTHASGLVHKSVRPEEVVIFQRSDSNSDASSRTLLQGPEPAIGAPFLTGFSSARVESANADSSLRINEDWQRDLYNHPSRQRQPTMKYTMAHDVFSVGIILLEIGLWESLIVLDDATKNDTINERAIPGGNQLYRNIRKTMPGAGTALKSTLEEVAEETLPSEMGSRYSGIVVRCLRAIEDGLELDGSLGEGSDVTISLGYIQLVLAELDNIRA